MEAFPRGRRLRSSDAAPAVPRMDLVGSRDFLFGAPKPKKEEAKSSDKPTEKSPAAAAAAEESVEAAKLQAYRPSGSRLVVGTKLLGLVTGVSGGVARVALPFGQTARFTLYPGVSVRARQWLPFEVVSTSNGVHVTLCLAADRSSLRAGVTVSAVLRAKEDHGWRVFLGSELEGFLVMEDDGVSGKDLEEGAVVMCRVSQWNPGRGLATLHLDSSFEEEDEEDEDEEVEKESSKKSKEFEKKSSKKSKEVEKESSKKSKKSSKKKGSTEASPSVVPGWRGLVPGALVSCTVNATIEGGYGVAMGAGEGKVVLHGTVAAEHASSERKMDLGRDLLARIVAVDVSGRAFAVSPLHIRLDKVASARRLSRGELVEATVVAATSKVGVWFHVAGESRQLAFAERSHLDVAKLSVARMYPVGSTHRARIMGFLPFDGAYKVSCAPKVVDAAAMSVADVHPGQLVEAVVLSPPPLPDTTGASSAVLELGPGVRALVTPMHLSDGAVGLAAQNRARERAQKSLKPGSKVWTRILSLDHNKIFATLKPSLVAREDRARARLGPEGEPLVSRDQIARQGPATVATGVVTGSKGNSLFITFFGGLVGRVTERQLGPPPDEADRWTPDLLAETYPIGAVLRPRILASSASASSKRMLTLSLLPEPSPLPSKPFEVTISLLDTQPPENTLLPQTLLPSYLKEPAYPNAQDAPFLATLPDGSHAILPTFHLADRIDVALAMDAALRATLRSRPSIKLPNVLAVARLAPPRQAVHDGKSISIVAVLTRKPSLVAPSTSNLVAATAMAVHDFGVFANTISNTTYFVPSSLLDPTRKPIDVLLPGQTLLLVPQTEKDEETSHHQKESSKATIANATPAAVAQAAQDSAEARALVNTFWVQSLADEDIAAALSTGAEEDGGDAEASPRLQDPLFAASSKAAALDDGSELDAIPLMHAAQEYARLVTSGRSLRSFLPLGTAVKVEDGCIVHSDLGEYTPRCNFSGSTKSATVLDAAPTAPVVVSKSSKLASKASNGKSGQPVETVAVHVRPTFYAVSNDLALICPSPNTASVDPIPNEGDEIPSTIKLSSDLGYDVRLLVPSASSSSASAVAKASRGNAPLSDVVEGVVTSSWTDTARFREISLPTHATPAQLHLADFVSSHEQPASSKKAGSKRSRSSSTSTSPTFKERLAHFLGLAEGDKVRLCVRQMGSRLIAFHPDAAEPMHISLGAKVSGYVTHHERLGAWVSIPGGHSAWVPAVAAGDSIQSIHRVLSCSPGKSVQGTIESPDDIPKPFCPKASQHFILRLGTAPDNFAITLSSSNPLSLPVVRADGSRGFVPVWGLPESLWQTNPFENPSLQPKTPVLVEDLVAADRDNQVEVVATVDDAETGSHQRSKRPRKDDEEKDGPAIGDVVKCWVLRTGPKGCFLQLANGRHGRVQLRDLSDSFVKDVAEAFPPGMLVAAKIKGITGDSFDLSLRPSDLLGEERSGKSPAALTRRAIAAGEIAVGQLVEGTIVNKERFGVFVALQDGSVALAHWSMLPKRAEAERQAARSARQDAKAGEADKAAADATALARSAPFKSGDKVQARIVDVDAEKGRISISLRPSDVLGTDSKKQTSSKKRNEASAASSSSSSSEEEDDDDEQQENSDEEDDDESSAESSSSSSSESEDDDDDEEDQEQEKQLPTLGDYRKMDVESSSEEEDDEDSDSEDDDSDEEDGGIGGGVRRKDDGRKKLSRAEILRLEAEAAAEEARLADGEVAPETTADFERLLAAAPASSLLWIKFMSFLLARTEVEAARTVAARALESVPSSAEDERFNIWVAWMNLEASHGTPRSLADVFGRALRTGDRFRLYEAMTSIFRRLERFDEAFQLLQVALKRDPRHAEFWESAMEMAFLRGTPEDGRALLAQATRALSKQDQIRVITRLATFEFRHGSKERGRTLLEEVLATYPKRYDVWLVLIDQEESIGNIDAARSLLHRLVAQPFSKPKMRSAFKRFLSFETKYGTEQDVENVRQLARDFVSRHQK